MLPRTGVPSLSAPRTVCTDQVSRWTGVHSPECSHTCAHSCSHAPACTPPGILTHWCALLHRHSRALVCIHTNAPVPWCALTQAFPCASCTHTRVSRSGVHSHMSVFTTQVLFLPTHPRCSPGPGAVPRSWVFQGVRQGRGTRPLLSPGGEQGTPHPCGHLKPRTMSTGWHPGDTHLLSLKPTGCWAENLTVFSGSRHTNLPHAHHRPPAVRRAAARLTRPASFCAQDGAAAST